MTCPKCGGTGWFAEYEPETGFVDIPCPWCMGMDGDEPNHVAEAGVVLTQEEMEADLYASTPLTPERLAFEEDMAWLEYRFKMRYRSKVRRERWDSY